MKTTKFLLIGLTSLVILFSCESDDNNSNATHELPSEFPLEVGNAWEYERTFYENGAIDTSYLDTLYIAGKYQDYFLWYWDSWNHYVLVKNSDNKLLYYGTIEPNDTIFRDEPGVWAFYGKTGCLDSTSFANYYYNSNIDSFCISIDENREYFGEKWDTYIEKRTYKDNRDKTLHYYNKLGFVEFTGFDKNNNLTFEHIMIKKLENANPPEFSNDAKKRYQSDKRP